MSPLSVVAALGRSGPRAQSASKGLLSQVFHIGDQTPSSSPVPSRWFRAARESGDATRNARSTRPHRAGWLTSASVYAASRGLWLPLARAVFALNATPHP